MYIDDSAEGIYRLMRSYHISVDRSRASEERRGAGGGALGGARRGDASKEVRL